MSRIRKAVANSPDPGAPGHPPHLLAEYQSGVNHLGQDFFLPCLRQCSQYDRAAGYFSSSSLRTWAGAIPHLLSEEARIRLIISPELSEQDIAALQSATDPDTASRLRDTAASRLLDAATKEASGASSNAHAEMLCWILIHGTLEIRFAFADNTPQSYLFHEKFGLFSFPSGHEVAFTGSANETASGHGVNFESIDVFRGWLDEDSNRVASKRERFDLMWNGALQGLSIRRVSPAMMSLIKERAPRSSPAALSTVSDSPELLNKWRHQEEATEAFLEAKSGILEMATGTGKTRTALNILGKLVSSGEVTSAIICTNGTDLLDQWHVELTDWAASRNWGIYRHYAGNHEIPEFSQASTHSIAIVSAQSIHKLFSSFPKDKRRTTMVIYDEVHGLGAPSLVSRLSGSHQSFTYKLGLSATPKREHDEDGTDFIYRELGKTIYSFDLEKAIQRGILVEFDYIPLPFELSDDDRRRIKKVYSLEARRKLEGNPMSREEIWRALARVYKTAENKPLALADYLRDHQDVLNRSIVFVAEKEYAEKIYDTVHEHTHRYSQYFDDDSPDVLHRFSSGDVDCLITCHKLSQGIDIKDLRSIILMSSDKGRLETTQRLGRCLRHDPNDLEKRATVIDFVRMPEKDSAGRPNTDKARADWLMSLSRARREE